MRRRFKPPTMMTKVGWTLAAALAVVALVPAEHLALTIGVVALGIALLVVIYLATTRSQVEKVVTIPLTNLGAHDRVRYREALEAAFNGIGRVEGVEDDKGRLELTIRTDRDLAAVHRTVRRTLGKGIQVLTFEGTIGYSALAPSGAAEIRVSGHVTPHAVVHIPGLDAPIVADAEGHFSHQVPYAAVKKHASGNRIKATYTHKGKDRQVVIDLGG